MIALAHMIEIHPKRLHGGWKAGFALDYHTIRRTLYDGYGRERFETERTAIGELLYRLKYKGDQSVGRLIVETAVGFLTSRSWPIDLIVPVPPSNLQRQWQPVLALAMAIALRTGVPYSHACMVKVRNTPQLKNVFGFDEGYSVLADAFAVDEAMVAKRSVLIFDDLYQSGATLRAVTEALLRTGKVRDVYVLTLTMTRGNR